MEGNFRACAVFKTGNGNGEERWNHRQKNGALKTRRRCMAFAAGGRAISTSPKRARWWFARITGATP